MFVSKIIHQTAPDDKKEWHPIWFACQKSWQDNFPENEYKYMFWNDDDLLELITKDFPDFLELYNDFGNDIILKVDFARYAILYKYGGIYADMDFMCKKNFYDQLTNNICIVESPANNEIIQNSLMASPPNDKRWIDVLQNCKEYYYDFIKTNPDTQITGKYVIDITGPRLLSRALDINSILILPNNLYNPYQNAFNSSEIYTKHYGTGKWGPGAGIRTYDDLINSDCDCDLYKIYKTCTDSNKYTLQNIPEGYIVMECGSCTSDTKTLQLNLSLTNNVDVFLIDHQYSDIITCNIDYENNILILKRLDGWGWGHNHCVYFTSNILQNIEIKNIQNIQIKNIEIDENDCIKIKIGPSNSNIKSIKLSLPLLNNTIFKILNNKNNRKFDLKINDSNILIVERIDMKEGWPDTFWVSIKNSD